MRFAGELEFLSDRVGKEQAARVLRDVAHMSNQLIQLGPRRVHAVHEDGAHLGGDQTDQMFE